MKMAWGIVMLSFFAVSTGTVYAQESGHSFSITPEIATKILLTDSLGAKLSPEAKRIIGRPYSPIPSHYTKNDTAFSASLFAPLAFDLQNLPSLNHSDLRGVLTLNNPYVQSTLSEKTARAEQERMAHNKVADVIRFANIANAAREYVMLNKPSAIRRTADQFPERVNLEQLGVEYGGELAQTDAPVIATSKPVPALEETIDRKYWIHKFEGSLHFAQSSVSKNWHKGGHNSLNFNSRVYYNITYKKDKINWVNELEYKLGLFANNVNYADKSSIAMKISEDFFRINSNYGVKAFDRWFYTIDAQLRSQLMTNRDAEGVLITRTFAPLHLSAGIGMKYELDLKNMNGDPFQKLNFTANIAPLSATMIYTYTDLIDKGRIGLQENERYKLRLGSTIHLNLTWDFNDRINWRSRLFYNTSYKHVEVEFENALSFAFNRFFSARLALDLRYDDSVIIEEPKTFKNLLQYNQLLSVGFEYKF